MTLYCPTCGAENRDDARFCCKCAAPMSASQPQSRLCAQCGTSNQPQARFCNRCGAPLSATPPNLQPSAQPWVPQVGTPAQANPPEAVLPVMGMGVPTAHVPYAGMPPARPSFSNTLQSGLTGQLIKNSQISGRYIIVKKLGQGGMGAVYLASDTRITGKLWAVKEMSDSALIDAQEKQQAKEAFRQEAILLSTLRHANIPQVTDFFEHGGKQYLVMDYVDGQTLQEMMEQHQRPFESAQVCEWAIQLCDVLNYLHNQTPPIIFRDLKPDNIMLDQENQLKLIDFGIVRFFKPGQSKDTQSLGTPGYAAPEQYGKGQSDARTDIYALGATMHYLLTNVDPSITPFQFQQIRMLNPAVPAQLETVIMRALEHSSVQRWSSAGDMQQALNQARRGTQGDPWKKPTPDSTPRPQTPPAAPVPVALPKSSPAKPAAKPEPQAPVPGIKRASFWGYVLAILIIGILSGLVLGMELDLVSTIGLLASSILAMVITKRPLASLFTVFLALFVYTTVLGQDYLDDNFPYMLALGAGIELGFLLGGYRKFSFWMIWLACGLGALGVTSIDWIDYGYLDEEMLFIWQASALGGALVSWIAGKIMKKI